MTMITVIMLIIINHANYEYIHDDCDDNHDDYVHDDEENVHHNNILFDGGDVNAFDDHTKDDDEDNEHFDLDSCTLYRDADHQDVHNYHYDHNVNFDDDYEENVDHNDIQSVGQRQQRYNWLYGADADH